MLISPDGSGVSASPKEEAARLAAPKRYEKMWGKVFIPLGIIKIYTPNVKKRFLICVKKVKLKNLEILYKSSVSPHFNNN